MVGVGAPVEKRRPSESLKEVRRSGRRGRSEGRNEKSWLQLVMSIFFCANRVLFFIDYICCMLLLLFACLRKPGTVRKILGPSNNKNHRHSLQES